jgi:hypothetical protein
MCPPARPCLGPCRPTAAARPPCRAPPQLMTCGAAPIPAPSPLLPHRATLKGIEPHCHPLFPPLHHLHSNQEGTPPPSPSGDLQSKSTAGPSFPTPESKSSPLLQPPNSELPPPAIGPSSLLVPPSCCRTHRSSSLVTRAPPPQPNTAASMPFSASPMTGNHGEFLPTSSCPAPPPRCTSAHAAYLAPLRPPVSRREPREPRTQ